MIIKGAIIIIAAVNKHSDTVWFILAEEEEKVQNYEVTDANSNKVAPKQSFISRW